MKSVNSLTRINSNPLNFFNIHHQRGHYTWAKSGYDYRTFIAKNLLVHLEKCY